MSRRWSFLVFTLVLVVLAVVLAVVACLGPGPATPGPRPGHSQVFYATGISPTFASGTGVITGTSTTYLTARSTSYACDGVSTTMRVGQIFATPNYVVMRLYLSFDTRAIPDTAVVLSSTVKLMLHADNSTANDFLAQVYRTIWSGALCDVRESAYDTAYGVTATLEGTIVDTSTGPVVGTYYTLPVATAGISLAGYSCYDVVSSRDVAGTTPTGGESVMFRTNNFAGTDADPILEVYWEAPTPTPTKSATPTATNTATPTPTATNTATPTPTVTPICPVSVVVSTTWGPGTVRVNCNVGVATGVTLTVAPGTEIVMATDSHWDVYGLLYAVGTAALPITFTTSISTVASSWGMLAVRSAGSRFEYARVEYGDGLNDAGGSVLRYCTLVSNTFGLASMSASDVQSSTLQWNGTGLLGYNEGIPVLDACNVLSNTWNAFVSSTRNVTVTNSWWGNASPDWALVWDHEDDYSLGLVITTGFASAVVSW